MILTKEMYGSKSKLLRADRVMEVNHWDEKLEKCG